MDLSRLTPKKGSVKKPKVQLGRGQGSNKGGTSGRGTKGQKSVSGYNRKAGFEGGQQPLQRRIPKFGFKNRNRVEYKAINLDTLQALSEKRKVNILNPNLIFENKLASKKDLIKILGRGELKTKLEVTAHAFSKSALAAIEKQGGKAIILNGNVPGKQLKDASKSKDKTKKESANKK